jgi:uncharacterized membrane protein
MEPALRVVLAWLLFATTHLVLASLRVRGPLVERLGPLGFLALYSAVAALSFGFAVWTFAAYRLEGAPGFGLAPTGLAGAVLIGTIVLGVTLMVASLADYPRSPMAIGGARGAEPYGLARVTRHGFFVGAILFAGAHALLAPHLAGAAGMAVLALFTALGIRLQDRKLLVLRGESYRRYLAATSTIPFAAILAGRQRLVWHELPFAGIALGLAAAWLLRSVHAGIFDHGGAWVTGSVVGGAFAAVALAARRERRVRAAARASA